MVVVHVDVWVSSSSASHIGLELVLGPSFHLNGYFIFDHLCVHTHAHPWRKEGNGFPGAGVTGGCEPLSLSGLGVTYFRS